MPGERRRHQPIATPQRVAIQTTKVYAGAAAGAHHLGFMIVHLQATHRGARTAGQHDQRISRSDLAAPHRAGGHGADAPEGKHAVDRQPGRARTAARHDLGRGALQSGQQSADAALVAGAHAHQLALRVGRAGEKFAHVVGRHLEQLVVHQVGLGERHHAVTHAEQLDDGQMLHRLRHHAVVGGHDQQEEIDARCAGHHGAHKAFVSGHVDDAQMAATGQQ